MRWLTLLGLSLCICALAGCSGNQSADGEPRAAKEQPPNMAPTGGKGQIKTETKTEERLTKKASDRKDGQEPADQKPENPPPPEDISHKLIFTGQIEVLVEDFDTQADVLKIRVKKLKGYIANSQDNGKAGAQRFGTYTIRVPAENFEQLMEELSALGELQRRSSDTQDITDQYYDTKAHIKNDEVREKGLQKLYDITAQKGRIEDLLVVDRELSSIRGRIEEQNGRVRRWDKEVAYSTIVVQLSQRTEYAVAGTPSYGTTLSRTWDGSLNALVAFGKGLLLVLVAMAPWLAVLLVVTSPLWFLLWRMRLHFAVKAAHETEAFDSVARIIATCGNGIRLSPPRRLAPLLSGMGVRTTTDRCCYIMGA